VAEYTALQMKKAVVGHGLANKAQVQEMVKRLLKRLPAPPGKDAADALGLAIAHAHAGASMAALAGATPLARRQHAQYRKGRVKLLMETRHGPTPCHAMDRHRPRLRRLSGPAAGRRGPGLLLWPGDLRRQPAHPRRGRAVRAGRLRGAGARRLLAPGTARRTGLRRRRPRTARWR
jgi:hypothetical protein